MALVILPEPAVQQTLDIDNLAVTLDGASVLGHLYAYDAVGNNWDRLRIGAAAGSLLVSLAAGGGVVDTELPAAVAAADNMANPTAPFVLSAGMLFDGATWDRWPGNNVDGALVNLGANNDVTFSGAVDTELPAAAALADAAANPTTPTVGVALLGFNGVTWDRLRSDIANGLDVDPTRLPNLSLTDFDTGIGTVNNYSIGIAVAADGGPAIITGDVANGLDVDVTRVTGTVTVDSELPAAAALADNAANPTAPAVGAFGMFWDGVTWDRAPGNSVDGALVNLGANNDVTVTGAVDTELPAAAALADAAANPTTPTVGAGLLFFNGVTWDRARGDIANGLDVDVTRVTGTVTVDSELPAAVAAADNMANPTAPQVLAHLMGWDGAMWDRVPATAADGVLVNLGANNDVTITGTVTVDSELPAAAALSDALANPTAPAVGAFGMGYDGTDWERFRVIEAPNARAGRSVGQQAVGKTEGKVTYRAVFADLAAPGGAGLAGVAVVLNGAAGVVVRVTKVQVAKPSVAQAPLRMQKTSAAHTAGTQTNPAGVPLDSADVAAAGVVRLYTVAPTGGGTVVGAVFDADVATGDVVYEDFGEGQNAQGLVLRGAAEGLAIQLSAAATLNGYIEWTEE